jgi:alpha-D-ribose 1-methylphosphonate 5-triphosphate diphosphatase PhnM
MYGTLYYNNYNKHWRYKMSNEEFQKLVMDKLNKIDLQVDENTQILKALEHKADINKAEHDKMFMDIAKISGKIEELRSDMSTVEVIAAKNNLDIAKLKAVK